MVEYEAATAGLLYFIDLKGVCDIKDGQDKQSGSIQKKPDQCQKRPWNIYRWKCGQKNSGNALQTALLITGAQNRKSQDRI